MHLEFYGGGGCSKYFFSILTFSHYWLALFLHFLLCGAAGVKISGPLSVLILVTHKCLSTVCSSKATLCDKHVVMQRLSKK